MGFIKTQIRQIKFNTAWESAQRQYPLSKIVWRTIDLHQTYDALSIEGEVKIVAFNEDGKQVYETEPKLHHCYRAFLLGDTANAFVNALTNILNKAQEEEPLTYNDILIEVANYGQEFGYLKVEIRGDSITLGAENSTLI